jgi:hypothetical protein
MFDRTGTLPVPPYHSPMRRGLYFVLMVVVVLRGLTGTAMAAGVLPPLLTSGMAPQQQSLPQHQHHHDEKVAAAEAGADHASHHDLQAIDALCEGESPDCDSHAHHSATCSACEICHSAMLDTPDQSRLTPSQPGNTLPPTADRFDSAPAALAIKPPIA